MRAPARSSGSSRPAGDHRQPDHLRARRTAVSRGPASRLAIRAPRSGTYATIHAVRTLVDLDAASKLLVFIADELDGLLVRDDALVDADGERPRVRFRVLDRDVDLELAE